MKDDLYRLGAVIALTIGRANGGSSSSSTWGTDRGGGCTAVALPRLEVLMADPALCRSGAAGGGDRAAARGLDLPQPAEERGSHRRASGCPATGSGGADGRFSGRGDFRGHDCRHYRPRVTAWAVNQTIPQAEGLHSPRKVVRGSSGAWAVRAVPMEDAARATRPRSRPAVGGGPSVRRGPSGSARTPPRRHPGRGGPAAAPCRGGLGNGPRAAAADRPGQQSQQSRGAPADGPLVRLPDGARRRRVGGLDPPEGHPDVHGQSLSSERGGRSRSCRRLAGAPGAFPPHRQRRPPGRPAPSLSTANGPAAGQRDSRLSLRCSTADDAGTWCRRRRVAEPAPGRAIMMYEFRRNRHAVGFRAVAISQVSPNIGARLRRIHLSRSVAGRPAGMEFLLLLLSFADPAALAAYAVVGADGPHRPDGWLFLAPWMRPPLPVCPDRRRRGGAEFRSRSVVN